MPPPSPPDHSETNLLGAFASLVGLLSIFLYFTGWVYRAAYFDFFQLQVANIGFPVESFFLISLQVFFKDLGRSLQTIIILIVISLVINLTLKLLTPTVIFPPPLRWLQPLHESSLFKKIRLLLNLLPEKIRQDSLVVVLLLLILYHYARCQGFYDARQSAHNSTSPLPVVTLVTKNQLALGRNPQDIFTDPKLEDYQIFGDKGLFDSLRGEEINDLAVNRVWRLLITSNGWIYIFPSLSDDSLANERPPVLAIRESSDQLMILSPEPVKKTP